MATRWIELVTGSIEDKRRYRRYKERVKQLPAAYRTAIEALGRYLTYTSGIPQGDVLVAMLEDLADLFEQSAADGTPIRQVVGDDPVEFVEDFLANYSDGRWVSKEQARLNGAIAEAEKEEGRGTP